MAANINRVVLVGNLTRDPEMKHLPSGTALCSLRIAVNTRRKDESGQWTDKPNYFDVSVWGNQGESCAQYLAKGRPVGVQGKLTWREWDAQDGTKRQSVEVTANNTKHRLNVFRAHTTQPRPESYFEDLDTAKHLSSDADRSRLYTDIATAAESGNHTRFFLYLVL